MERLKAIAEKIADWMDDRWTWAAIGLLTGYFGFGSSDTLEWQAWQEAGIAIASLVLILIRDKKRRGPDGKAVVIDSDNTVPVPTPVRVRESMPSEYDPKIDGHGFGDK